MNKLFSAALLSLSLVAVPGLATAANGYETISPALNTSTEDKVEVMEFFWLGCPHCYALEPEMEKWNESKPDHVALVREAPPLNPAWEQHSRGFYAAQIMNIEDEFVAKMFDAIHGDNGSAMRKPSDIAELASTLGVDKSKFQSTMKSFAVQTKMARAMQLAQSAGITGVPAVVINGKYLTSASLAGGNKGIIDVIEKTVEVEHAQSGS